MNKNCIICGKPIPDPAPYSSPVCSHECFIEKFWNEALDETAIIIDGHCYHDGGCVGHLDPYNFYGYGGRMFYIQMNNGYKFKTNNLWYNGEIPKNRNVNDNAKFIRKEDI